MDQKIRGEDAREVVEFTLLYFKSDAHFIRQIEFHVLSPRTL